MAARARPALIGRHIITNLLGRMASCNNRSSINRARRQIIETIVATHRKRCVLDGREYRVGKTTATGTVARPCSGRIECLALNPQPTVWWPWPQSNREGSRSWQIVRNPNQDLPRAPGRIKTEMKRSLFELPPARIALANTVLAARARSLNPARGAAEEWWSRDAEPSRTCFSGSRLSPLASPLP